MQHKIWNEKYRCTNIDDFVCSDQVRADIKSYIKNNDIPHLLLAGKTGAGKTTLAKLLYTNLDCDYLFINASDENGIETIREKVKNFASSASFKSIKIVVLDEADYLTKEAQAALRNVIESFSLKTRFILTCNYIEKIIEPLQSRCNSIKLEVIPDKNVLARFQNILNSEKIEHTLIDIDKVIKNTYPDIRKGINFLQNCSLSGKLVVDLSKLSSSDYTNQVIELLKKPTKETWKAIRQVLANNNVRDYQDMLRELFEHYQDQSQIVIAIAESQYKQSFVPDKEINFLALIYTIIENGNTK